MTSWRPHQGMSVWMQPRRQKKMFMIWPQAASHPTGGRSCNTRFWGKKIVRCSAAFDAMIPSLINPARPLLL